MKSPIQRQMELFSAALEHPAGPERDAFLAKACAGDDALIECVRTLLAGHSQAGSFLAQAAGPTGTHLLPSTEKPGDKIGRYKLLQQIGEGGCGTVYMAEQEEPVRRRVALKVIRLGMDTKSVIARFEAERQALALMDHPNIAKVFDGGATDSGRPYFVMELVRGIKITDYCDQAHLSTAERLQLFIQVCQAVQHAHQKGIIHRDIKPSNILVTVNDGVAVPKVIDFGIAKATDQRLTDKSYFTEFHAFIGTPAYTSPEQAEMSSLDIDTRSDIYSLGVLLYEMLTGQTPFPAERLLHSGLDEMRRIIREEEPPRPSARLTTLPLADASELSRKRQLKIPALANAVEGDIDWIVMKALEKDRSRRYATSLDFAADLQRHLNNEAVLARPPSLAYKFQRAVRRNKGAFAAAAAVFLTLLTGLSLTAWQAVRATKAENEARTKAGEAATQQARAETEADRARSAQKQAEQQRARAEGNAYVASMNLLQQAWAQNNVARVKELLEETASYPGRGFEWYYWQRQTHTELMILRGHLGGVASVAYSADGKRIVTGSDDHTVKVWDAASGKELLTLQSQGNDISSVCFSPNCERILAGTYDATVTIWDASNGKELLTFKGHGNSILSVAYSPDGQRILTGGDDDTAEVWDAASGKELLTFKGHGGRISSVAFSPDGLRILTGSDDQTVKVWDAANGKELLTLEGHSVGISSIAFSSDGQRILTGSGDHTAKVWDAASGKELHKIQGHGGGINSVAFSPDSQRIVTGSWDGTAKLWDVASGKQLLTVKDDSINSVAFSPDGQRIVTGSDDQTAKVWDTTIGKELRPLQGHTEVIRSVAYSSVVQRILTGSDDQTAKAWDAATGKELLSLNGNENRIYSVAFSPDGQRILTGSWGGTAKLWDAATGKEQRNLQGHSGTVYCVAFSPGGQRILTGSDDRTAKVWDATTGKELLTLRGHLDAIQPVAFSPDGQRILTGSWDQTAKVWDATNGKELLTLHGHTDRIYSMTFSPDGQRIVTGSIDYKAKVWDATSGKELLTLQGHGGGINSVAFSPDGQRILTGSWDGTARLWDVASGKELLTLTDSFDGQNIKPIFVTFSPDGQRILTGGDGVIRYWNAATHQQVARWQQEEQAAAAHLAQLQKQRDQAKRAQTQP